MSDKLGPKDWENHFTEEALLTEELVTSGDFAFLNQSKIRISLENKILSWEKYTAWVRSENIFGQVKENLNSVQIDSLIKKYNENKKTFKHYGIWSEDLIALEMWDDQIVILGLIPTDKILSIPNALFILCPPAVLNQIIKFDQKELETIEDSNRLTEKTSTELDLLLDIDQNILGPLNFNFADISAGLQINSNTSDVKENTKTAFSVWTSIDEKHPAHSDLARKKFDAYVVLKIIDGKTKVFKMDEDLTKENLNEGLFIYDMKSVNPFSKVLKNGTSDSFNLSQLGFSVLDFKFACVTPLKIGSDVLGFLIGFKIAEPDQSDESVLESISSESIAA